MTPFSRRFRAAGWWQKMRWRSPPTRPKCGEPWSSWLIWLGQAVQEGRATLNSLRTSTTQKNDLAEAFKNATEECRLVGPCRGFVLCDWPLKGDASGSSATNSIVSAMRPFAMPARTPEGSRLEVELEIWTRSCPARQRQWHRHRTWRSSITGKEGHFGLQGLRERVARIGGKLAIAIFGLVSERRLL